MSSWKYSNSVFYEGNSIYCLFLRVKSILFWKHYPKTFSDKLLNFFLSGTLKGTVKW